MSLAHSFRSIIPPPHFLEMPSIGVDISDTSLKYIKCVPKHSKKTFFDITHYGDIDIDEGALHRGVVQEPEKLSQALSEMRERTGIDMVRVSLPEERAYIFETTIGASSKASEVRNLIEFKLEENVPLSPRDAYFDYEILPNQKTNSEIKVLVTVYARETVERYYEACREARLIPLSFEVEAQAIARSTIASTDNGTHMIVDFGKTRTGIGIVNSGVLMYTSTIELGGGNLSQAMRLVLGDTPESELTNIKNTQGLVNNPANPELSVAIKSVVDDIIDELRTRIEYWNTRSYGGTERFIESIVLCGGSVNMKGIQRYISEELGIRAERANVWQNVTTSAGDLPPIKQRFAYGYSTAIGLALGAYLK